MTSSGSNAAVELAGPAPTPAHVTQATAVEQSRAVAEVQAFVAVARTYPRDPLRVNASVERACSSFLFAERAFYSVPNRGTGLSVSAARELARLFGHIRYGVVELHRDDAARMSEIRAYAWDVQDGTYAERVFQVPHQQMQGKGAAARRVDLTDLMDVYRNNQSVGGRAVREVILQVLPAHLVATAERALRDTLNRGDGQTLDQRAQSCVDAFAGLGVTVAQLEGRVRRKRDQWTAEQVAALGVVFRSLQNGESALAEEFPSTEVSTEDVVAQAATRRGRAQTPPPEVLAAQPSEAVAAADRTPSEEELDAIADAEAAAMTGGTP